MKTTNVMHERGRKLRRSTGDHGESAAETHSSQPVAARAVREGSNTAKMASQRVGALSTGKRKGALTSSPLAKKGRHSKSLSSTPGTSQKKREPSPSQKTVLLDPRLAHRNKRKVPDKSLSSLRKARKIGAGLVRSKSKRKTASNVVVNTKDGTDTLDAFSLEMKRLATTNGFWSSKSATADESVPLTNTAVQTVQKSGKIPSSISANATSLPVSTPTAQVGRRKGTSLSVLKRLKIEDKFWSQSLKQIGRRTTSKNSRDASPSSTSSQDRELRTRLSSSGPNSLTNVEKNDEDCSLLSFSALRRLETTEGFWNPSTKQSRPESSSKGSRDVSPSSTSSLDKRGAVGQRSKSDAMGNRTETTVNSNTQIIRRLNNLKRCRKQASEKKDPKQNDKDEYETPLARAEKSVKAITSKKVGKYQVQDLKTKSVVSAVKEKKDYISPASAKSNSERIRETKPRLLDKTKPKSSNETKPRHSGETKQRHLNANVHNARRKTPELSKQVKDSHASNSAPNVTPSKFVIYDLLGSSELRRLKTSPGFTTPAPNIGAVLGQPHSRRCKVIDDGKPSLNKSSNTPKLPIKPQSGLLQQQQEKLQALKNNTKISQAKLDKALPKQQKSSAQEISKSQVQPEAIVPKRKRFHFGAKKKKGKKGVNLKLLKALRMQGMLEKKISHMPQAHDSAQTRQLDVTLNQPSSNDTPTASHVTARTWRRGRKKLIPGMAQFRRLAETIETRRSRKHKSLIEKSLDVLQQVESDIGRAEGVQLNYSITSSQSPSIKGTLVESGTETLEESAGKESDLCPNNRQLQREHELQHSTSEQDVDTMETVEKLSQDDAETVLSKSQLQRTCKPDFEVSSFSKGEESTEKHDMVCDLLSTGEMNGEEAESEMNEVKIPSWTKDEDYSNADRGDKSKSTIKALQEAYIKDEKTKLVLIPDLKRSQESGNKLEPKEGTVDTKIICKDKEGAVAEVMHMGTQLTEEMLEQHGDDDKGVVDNMAVIQGHDNSSGSHDKFTSTPVQEFSVAKQDNLKAISEPGDLKLLPEGMTYAGPGMSCLLSGKEELVAREKPRLKSDMDGENPIVLNTVSKDLADRSCDPMSENFGLVSEPSSIPTKSASLTTVAASLKGSFLSLKKRMQERHNPTHDENILICEQQKIDQDLHNSETSGLKSTSLATSDMSKHMLNDKECLTSNIVVTEPGRKAAKHRKKFWQRGIMRKPSRVSRNIRRKSQTLNRPSHRSITSGSSTITSNTEGENLLCIEENIDTTSNKDDEAKVAKNASDSRVIPGDMEPAEIKHVSHENDKEMTKDKDALNGSLITNVEVSCGETFGDDCSETVRVGGINGRQQSSGTADGKNDLMPSASGSTTSYAAHEAKPEKEKVAEKKLVKMLRRLQTNANLANAVVDEKGLQTRTLRGISHVDVNTKKQKMYGDLGQSGEPASSTSLEPVDSLKINIPEESIGHVRKRGRSRLQSPSSLLMPTDVHTQRSRGGSPSDILPPTLSPQIPDVDEDSTNLPAFEEQEVVPEGVEEDYRLYFSGASDDDDDALPSNFQRVSGNASGEAKCLGQEVKPVVPDGLKAMEPDGVKAMEPIVSDAIKTAEPNVVEAAEPVARDDVKAVEPVAPDDVKVVEPVAPDDVKAVEPVAPDSFKAVEPVAPDSVKAVEPVAPDSVKAVEPVAPDSVKAVEPVAPDSVKAVELVAPDDVKAVEPVAPDSVKAVEPVAPDSVKAVEPVAPDDVKAVEPVAPDDVKAVEPVAPDSVKAVELVAPDNVKAVEPDGRDGVKAVEPVAPDGVESVETVTPDGVKNVEVVASDVIETVELVASDVIETVQPVIPDGVETVELVVSDGVKAVSCLAQEHVPSPQSSLVVHSDLNRQVVGAKIKGKKGRPPGMPMTMEYANVKRPRTARKSMSSKKPIYTSCSSSQGTPWRKFEFRKKSTRSPLEMLEMKRKQEEAIYDLEEEKRQARLTYLREKRNARLTLDEYDSVNGDVGEGEEIRPCSVVLSDFIKKLQLDFVDPQPDQESWLQEEVLPESPEYDDRDTDEDWCADLEDLEEDDEEWKASSQGSRPYIPRLKLKRVLKKGKPSHTKKTKSKASCLGPTEHKPIKLIIKTEPNPDVEQHRQSLGVTASSNPAQSASLASVERSGFEGSYVDFLRGKKAEPLLGPRHDRKSWVLNDKKLSVSSSLQSADTNVKILMSKEPVMESEERDDSVTEKQKSASDAERVQTAPSEAPTISHRSNVSEHNSTAGSQSVTTSFGAPQMQSGLEVSRNLSLEEDDDDILIVDLEEGAADASHSHNAGKEKSHIIIESHDSINQRGHSELGDNICVEKQSVDKTILHSKVLPSNKFEKEKLCAKQNIPDIISNSSTPMEEEKITTQSDNVSILAQGLGEDRGTACSGNETIVKTVSSNESSVEKVGAERSISSSYKPVQGPKDLITKSHLTVGCEAENNNVPLDTESTDQVLPSPMTAVICDKSALAHGKQANEWKLKLILQSDKAPSGKYSCKRCSFTTATKLTIESHIYSHIPGVQFRCSYCESEFSSMAATATHLKNTHSIKEAKFHISRHIEEKNFYHREDKVFAEDIAVQAASEQANSSGEKSPPVVISLVVSGAMGRGGGVRGTPAHRFVCTHCGFSTNVREAAEHHVSDLHSAQSLFACVLCNEDIFYTEEEIKQHSATVHPTRTRPYRKLPDFYDAEQLSLKSVSSGQEERAEDLFHRMSSLLVDESEAELGAVDHRQRAKDYLYVQEGWKEKTSAEADSTTAGDYTEETVPTKKDGSLTAFSSDQSPISATREDECPPPTPPSAERDLPISPTRMRETQGLPCTPVSHGRESIPSTSSPLRNSESHPDTGTEEVTVTSMGKDVDDADKSQVDMDSSEAVTIVHTLRAGGSLSEEESQCNWVSEMTPEQTTRQVMTVMTQEENDQLTTAVSTSSVLQTAAPVVGVAQSDVTDARSCDGQNDLSENTKDTCMGLKIVEVVSLSEEVKDLSLSSASPISHVVTDSFPSSEGIQEGASDTLLPSVPTTLESISTVETTSTATAPVARSSESKLASLSTPTSSAASSSSSSSSSSSQGRLPLSYKCSACRVHTPYLLMMVKHLKAKHPQIQCFACPYCKKMLRFSSQKQLRSHVKHQHPNKLERNEISLSEEAKQLVEAMVMPPSPECVQVGNRLVLEEDIHTCTHCQLKMTSLANVYEHLNRVHSDLFEFVCPVCQTFKHKVLTEIFDHCSHVHKSAIDTDKVHVSVPKNLFSVLTCISKNGKYMEKSLETGGTKRTTSSSPIVSGPTAPVQTKEAQIHVGKSDQRNVKQRRQASSLHIHPSVASTVVRMSEPSPQQTIVSQTPLFAIPINPGSLYPNPQNIATTKPMIAISSALFDTSSLLVSPQMACAPNSIHSAGAPTASSFLTPNPQKPSSKGTQPHMPKHSHLAPRTMSATGRILPVLNVPTVRPRSSSVSPGRSSTSRMASTAAGGGHLTKSAATITSSLQTQESHNAQSVDNLPDNEPNPDAFKIFNLQPLGSPSVLAPSSCGTPTVFPPASGSLLHSGFLQTAVPGFPPGVLIPPPPNLMPQPFPFHAEQSRAMNALITQPHPSASPHPVAVARLSPSVPNFPDNQVAQTTTAMLLQRQQKELYQLKQHYQLPHNQLSLQRQRHFTKHKLHQRPASVGISSLPPPPAQQESHGCTPSSFHQHQQQQQQQHSVIPVSSPARTMSAPISSSQSRGMFQSHPQTTMVPSSPRSGKGVHKRSSVMYQCPYCPTLVTMKAIEVPSHIQQQHPGCQLVFKKIV